MKAFPILVTLFLLIMVPEFSNGQIKGEYMPERNTFQPTDRTLKVGEFIHGLAIIGQGEKYGIIDTSGSLFRPIEQSIRPLPLLRPEEDRPALLSGLGVLLITPDESQKPATAYCTGGNAGTYLLCDLSGNLFLKEWLIWKETDERFEMVKPDGTIHIRLYNKQESFPDCALCGHCYGYMGIIGQDSSYLVAPNKYLEIGDYQDGLAIVQNGKGRWGYIDSAGKEVIKCKYETVYPFSNGRAAVVNKRGAFYIDAKGKRIRD